VKIIVVCDSCEAEYNIIHDMNERNYKLSFCSFCGNEVELEEDMLQELYTEDDEDEWQG
jgi:hypothetical protein